MSSPPFKPASVEGRIILITGAAGAMGRATALLLAHSGAKVGLLDFIDPASVASEINDALGAGTAVAVSCDVRKADSVEEAVSKIAKELGPIDGAANLAGVIGKGRKIGTTQGQLKDMDDAEWDRVCDINLGGVKNCLRSELRHFNPKGGSIVNAASVAGQEALPFNSAYGASKAAVISLTKSVAKEVASQGIMVNSIAPGVVHTPLMTAVADEETLQKFGKRAALGRLAQADEIAKLIFWLLSDHNTFATASTFNIDGGW